MESILDQFLYGTGLKKKPVLYTPQPTPMETSRVPETTHWETTLKSYRNYTEIPTTPPGTDFENILDFLGSDPNKWERIIAIDDVTIPDKRKGEWQMLFNKPGFLFIKGLKGGNKSLESIGGLSAKTIDSVMKLPCDDGIEIWHTKNLDSFTHDDFQYDLISEKKNPIAFAKLQSKLGKDVFSENRLFIDHDRSPNNINIGF